MDIDIQDMGIIVVSINNNSIQHIHNMHTDLQSSLVYLIFIHLEVISV